MSGNQIAKGIQKPDKLSDFLMVWQQFYFGPLSWTVLYKRIFFYDTKMYKTVKASKPFKNKNRTICLVFEWSDSLDHFNKKIFF
jgi:hypothetical protein